MKTRMIMLLLFVSGILSFTSLNAEETPVLPGRAFVHVQTGPLQDSIGNIENFLLESLKGTGAEMFFRQGSIGMMLPMMMKMPTQLIDMSKPGHFVLLLPRNDNWETAPKFAFVLPVSDFKTRFTAEGEAGKMGMSPVQNEDGTISVNMPMMPAMKSFTKDAGNGYVATGPDAATVSAIADMFAEIQKDTAPEKSLIYATVDFDKMLASGKPQLLEQAGAFTKMNAIQDRELQQGINIIFTMAASIAEPAIKIAEELKAFNLNLEGDSEAALFTFTAAPKTKTQMERIFETLASTKNDYSVLKQFPEKSIFYYSTALGKDEQSRKELVKLYCDFLDIFKDSLTEEERASVEKLTQKTFSSLRGTQSGYAIFNEKNMRMETDGIYEVTDAKEYIKTLPEIYDASFKLANKLYPLFGLQVSISSEFKNDIAEVEGVSISNCKMIFTAQEEAPQMLKDMFANFDHNYYMAPLDKQLVMVQATDVETAKTKIGNLIKSVRNDSQPLGKRKGFAEAFDKYSKDTSAYGGMYLLDLIRANLMQQYNLMTKNEQMKDLGNKMLNAAKGIGLSSEPVIFTCKNDENKCVMQARISSRTVNETGLEMKAFGTRMQAAFAPPAPGQSELANKARNNLKQIGLGVMMYADGHDGNLPANLEDLREFLPNMDDIIVNPETGRQFIIQEKYAGKKAADFEKPSSVIIIRDPVDSYPEGGNALFVDGHVEFLPDFHERIELTEEEEKKIQGADIF